MGKLSIIAIGLAGLMAVAQFSFAVDLFDLPSERGTDKANVSQNKRVKQSSTQKTPSEDSLNLASSIFEKVSGSVVIVEAQTPDGKVQGSGVVYDITFFTTQETELQGNADKLRVDTLIVTNAHVIRNGNAVSVLQGGKRYQATIEYVNSELDLAFLYVRGISLPISRPFSGAPLKVGEKVFAVGSPLGLENTISEGIISGKRQENGVLFLQTTASISHGSSGGGLFDGKGRFVGVTTFKVVGGENLNFAVDAEYVSDFDIARFPIYMLRWAASVSLPGLSQDQMGIINSPTFAEWLLKTRDEQGEELYIKLARELEKNTGTKADSPESWSAAEYASKEYAQILNQFFADQESKTADTQATPNIVLLICSMVLHVPEHEGDRMDMSVKLDYTNKTVDGFPATFTDTEVTWKTTPGGPWKGKEGYAVLNRYTGFLKLSVRPPVETLFSGHCSPAPERKF